MIELNEPKIFAAIDLLQKYCMFNEWEKSVITLLSFENFEIKMKAKNNKNCYFFKYNLN